MKHNYLKSVFCTIVLVLNLLSTYGNVIQLQDSNLKDVLSDNEIVFINFYADWCHFSQMLTPIFEETSQILAEEIKEKNRVAFGKVDCDAQPGIAQTYKVSKYPTLKMTRYGQPLKREYRGQRSKEALANFVREQMKDPIHYVKTSEAPYNYETGKRYIVGHMGDDSGPIFDMFRKVASVMRDDCTFVLITGNFEGGPYVSYKGGQDSELRYPHSDLTKYDQLHSWSSEMCVPLVRELTFQNAEELTEEGLPFLVLFHHPDDKETPKTFKEACERELIHEKYNVNFLTGDGVKFSHPLHHLGKSEADLPLICIDSFKHMYIYKSDVRTGLKQEGQLRQFVADLHSGKLHREYHYGPEDPKPPPVIISDDGTVKVDDAAGTTPPDSIFKKLSPSRTRYTILRDEL